MGLTMGTGPFGKKPAGTFNFQPDPPKGHALYLEPSPRRVRGVIGGETVVDSCHVALLFETGYLPIWYFPRSDVRFDLLEATEHTTHCPFKGDARYWTIRAGGKVAENKVWGYPETLPETPPITDRVAFYWDAVEHWYEEDEEVFGHPRDPWHRVDARRSARHVRVEIGGEAIADSRRPTVVFETGLPTRYYLPRSDVAMESLEATDTRTICAYKGFASYWSVGEERDVAWTYEEPFPDAPPIAGLVCFLNERTDMTVDGAPVERPSTQWSAGIRSAPRGGGSGARQGPHEVSDT